MRLNFIFIVSVILLVVFIDNTKAHENSFSQPELKINERLNLLSFILISISSVIITLTVIISIIYKNKLEKLKIFLFLLIVLPTIITTIYLVSATIYTNSISETKGPVHHHADFEIWNCGSSIAPIDPRGLSNRVGTSLLHEHGDNRIHIEGVVRKKEDITLHNFFDVIGSHLTKDALIVSTNSGDVEMKNGNLCNGKEAKLQVFVYQVTNPSPVQKKGFFYKQIKLEDFENYIISPYQNIPPGDCIIIEFDSEKEKTDKICESYRALIERGEIKNA